MKSWSACPLLVLSIASALVVLGTVGLVGCKGFSAAAISSIGEIVTKKYMSRLNTNNVEKNFLSLADYLKTW